MEITKEQLKIITDLVEINRYAQDYTEAQTGFLAILVRAEEVVENLTLSVVSDSHKCGNCEKPINSEHYCDSCYNAAWDSLNI